MRKDVRFATLTIFLLSILSTAAFGALDAIENFFDGGWQQYEKTIVFVVFFFLFYSVYLIGMKNAFETLNRAHTAFGFFAALLSSMIIVSTINVDFVNLKYVAWALLALVVFFLLYMMFSKMFGEGKSLWAFLLAILFAALLLWLLWYLMNEGNSLEGVGGFGDWLSGIGTPSWGDAPSIDDVLPGSGDSGDSGGIFGGGPAGGGSGGPPGGGGGGGPGDSGGFFGDTDLGNLIYLLPLLLILGGGYMGRNKVKDWWKNRDREQEWFYKRWYEKWKKRREEKKKKKKKKKEKKKRKLSIAEIQTEITNVVEQKKKILEQIREIALQKEMLSEDLSDNYLKVVQHPDFLRDPAFFKDMKQPEFKWIMNEDDAVTKLLKLEIELEQKLIVLMDMEHELIGDVWDKGKIYKWMDRIEEEYAGLPVEATQGNIIEAVQKIKNVAFKRLTEKDGLIDGAQKAIAQYFTIAKEEQEAEKLVHRYSKYKNFVKWIEEGKYEKWLELRNRGVRGLFDYFNKEKILLVGDINLQNLPFEMQGKQMIGAPKTDSIHGRIFQQARYLKYALALLNYLENRNLHKMAAIQPVMVDADGITFKNLYSEELRDERGQIYYDVSIPTGKHVARVYTRLQHGHDMKYSFYVDGQPDPNAEIQVNTEGEGGEYSQWHLIQVYSDLVRSHKEGEHTYTIVGVDRSKPEEGTYYDRQHSTKVVVRFGRSIQDVMYLKPLNSTCNKELPGKKVDLQTGNEVGEGKIIFSDKPKREAMTIGDQSCMVELKDCEKEGIRAVITYTGPTEVREGVVAGNHYTINVSPGTKFTLDGKEIFKEKKGGEVRLGINSEFMIEDYLFRVRSKDIDSNDYENMDSIYPIMLTLGELKDDEEFRRLDKLKKEYERSLANFMNIKFDGHQKIDNFVIDDCIKYLEASLNDIELLRKINAGPISKVPELADQLTRQVNDKKQAKYWFMNQWNYSVRALQKDPQGREQHSRQIMKILEDEAHDFDVFFSRARIVPKGYIDASRQLVAHQNNIDHLDRPPEKELKLIERLKKRKDDLFEKWDKDMRAYLNTLTFREHLELPSSGEVIHLGGPTVETKDAAHNPLYIMLMQEASEMHETRNRLVALQDQAESEEDRSGVQWAVNRCDINLRDLQILYDIGPAHKKFAVAYVDKMTREADENSKYIFFNKWNKTLRKLEWDHKNRPANIATMIKLIEEDRQMLELEFERLSMAITGEIPARIGNDEINNAIELERVAQQDLKKRLYKIQENGTQDVSEYLGQVHSNINNIALIQGAYLWNKIDELEDIHLEMDGKNPKRGSQWNKAIWNLKKNPENKSDLVMELMEMLAEFREEVKEAVPNRRQRRTAVIKAKKAARLAKTRAKAEEARARKEAEHGPLERIIHEEKPAHPATTKKGKKQRKGKKGGSQRHGPNKNPWRGSDSFKG